MTTPLYAIWTEYNEWEGETWRFYIPILGNSQELIRLQAWCNQESPDSPYRLDTRPLLEDEVDRRVETMADDTSYLAAHTKLAGRLVLPDVIDADDTLYKGGIRNLIVSDRREVLDELTHEAEDLGLYETDQTALKRQDDQDIEDFYADVYDDESE